MQVVTRGLANSYLQRSKRKHVPPAQRHGPELSVESLPPLFPKHPRDYKLFLLARDQLAKDLLERKEQLTTLIVSSAETVFFPPTHPLAGKGHKQNLLDSVREG